MQIEVNAQMMTEAGEVEDINKEMEIESTTTIKEVLMELGYEDLKSVSVVVNGRKKGIDYQLNPDDNLTVFSPMTGG